MRNWRDQAACLAVDGDVFYPEGRGRAFRDAEERAVAVCRTCPVATQCLAYALGRRDVWGVWGGTTEDERKEMLSIRVRRVA